MYFYLKNIIKNTKLTQSLTEMKAINQLATCLVFEGIRKFYDVYSNAVQQMRQYSALTEFFEEQREVNQFIFQFPR